MVLKQFTKNESLKKPLLVIDGKQKDLFLRAETARVATQTLSEMNAIFTDLENPLN